MMIFSLISVFSVVCRLIGPGVGRGGNNGSAYVCVFHTQQLLPRPTQVICTMYKLYYSRTVSISSQVGLYTRLSNINVILHIIHDGHMAPV